jgi:single-stranded DNA-binding protein
VREDTYLERITGNAGKDAEVRETKVGDIVSFSVAVTMKYGKQEDQVTRWVQVAVFDERQEDDQDDELSPWQKRILDAVGKGSKVAVEGIIKSRKVDGKTYYDMTAKRVGIVECIPRDSDNGKSRKASTKKSSRSRDDDDEDEPSSW